MHILIIVGTAAVGELILALLVGGILHSSSEPGDAAERRVIPFSQRDPRESLAVIISAKDADIGYLDGDAA